MSHVPAPESNGPTRLLGVLWSWLHGRSSHPTAPTKGPTGESRLPGAHSYGEVRVLVVDDNPVNLMLVSAMMEARGFVPLLASDGAEAVALACDLHFDLILMDLQMPVLDGLGATVKIRRFEAAGQRPAVPVVAYTSLSPGSRDLTAHGLNGSLRKPCEDHELEACLVRWCPTYRPSAAGRAAAETHRGWQAAAQHADTRRTLLRTPRV